MIDRSKSNMFKIALKYLMMGGITVLWAEGLNRVLNYFLFKFGIPFNVSLLELFGIYALLISPFTLLLFMAYFSKKLSQTDDTE